LVSYNNLASITTNGLGNNRRGRRNLLSREQSRHLSSVTVKVGVDRRRVLKSNQEIEHATFHVTVPPRILTLTTTKTSILSSAVSAAKEAAKVVRKIFVEATDEVRKISLNASHDIFKIHLQ
jgi:hypothetical protein